MRTFRTSYREVANRPRMRTARRRAEDFMKVFLPLAALAGLCIAFRLIFRRGL